MRVVVVFSFFFFIVSFVAKSQLLSDENEKGKTDKMLLDFYHDNWIEGSGNLNVNWKSFGWGVSFMYDIPVNGVKNVSTAVGIGYGNHNVRVPSEVLIIDNSDTIVGGNYSILSPISASRGISKHKIATNYIDIPLELRFRSKTDQHGNQLKFTLGAKAGMLVNIHSKYFQNGDKYKSYIFPNKNKWRYGAYFRFGYQRWTMYGYYSVSTLFNKDKGTSVNPISLGISFAIL